MNGPPCRLIALHGFLGGPGDWESVRGEIPWAMIDAMDLWPLTAAAGADSWRSIGRLLESELQERAGRKPELPAVVLAYSFGARLALAVDGLAEGRLPVAAACLVSCNPGLPEGERAARDARREADGRWARMFMEASETEIRRAWEKQPVLSGGADGADPARASASPAEAAEQRRRMPATPVDLLPAPRHTLAVAMRRFSLADQPDFTSRLAGWRTPLLWVTGERDEKFTSIASALRRSGVPADFAVCDSAGHRVPWDNPGGFEALLRGWLEKRLAGGRGARR